MSSNTNTTFLTLKRQNVKCTCRNLQYIFKPYQTIIRMKVPQRSTLRCPSAPLDSAKACWTRL